VAFIELRRDENFPKTLMDLIAQINNLTNVEQWQYITPSQSNPVDLDEKSLQDSVMLDPDDIVSDDIDSHEQDLDEFWNAAEVDTILIEGSIVSLVSGQASVSLCLVPLDESQAIDPFCTQAHRLQSILGSNYGVYKIGAGFLIEHGAQRRYCLPPS